MAVKLSIPTLTFPDVKYGKLATPWNLGVLLYPGLSGQNARRSAELLSAGELGAPVADRVAMVEAFHEVLSGKLTAGQAQASVGQAISRLRQFVSHVDVFSLPLDKQSVEKSFLHWTDHLVHRHRTVKDISEYSAYQTAAMVSGLIDEVLGRSSSLITLSRLKAKPPKPKALGVQVEKQSLESAFAFGHLVKDVCDSLTEEVVLRGPIPIVIKIRSGGQIEHWCQWVRERPDEGLRRFQAEGTLRSRAPLANLRIEAEILMFIGQTGMNCTQALKLRIGKFQYASHIDGYQVREYKGRRKGPVIFEIYKEYRSHFERYLQWRSELFPASDVLFPFINTYGGPEFGPRNWQLRRQCECLGIAFVGPRALRNTRVNWLLRRSSDPALTAEMAQHTEETLLKVYDRPSLQRAGGELLRFWAQHDPALAGATSAIAPGHCNGRPEPIPEMPVGATTPDCIRASGCLWCAHHRDIDEFEYVWALVCFGHIKEFEANKRPPSQAEERTAAQCALNRIRDKLTWLNESNPKRRDWVDEAHARVEEGSYHPSWKRLIRQFQPI